MGRVEITLSDKKTRIVLREGHHFGEAALTTTGVHTQTVQSVTFCDIYSLTREDLDAILKYVPEEERRDLFATLTADITKRAKTRQRTRARARTRSRKWLTQGHAELLVRSSSVAFMARLSEASVGSSMDDSTTVLNSTTIETPRRSQALLDRRNREKKDTFDHYGVNPEMESKKTKKGDEGRNRPSYSMKSQSTTSKELMQTVRTVMGARSRSFYDQDIHHRRHASWAFGDSLAPLTPQNRKENGKKSNKENAAKEIDGSVHSRRPTVWSETYVPSSPQFDPNRRRSLVLGGSVPAPLRNDFREEIERKKQEILESHASNGVAQAHTNGHVNLWNQGDMVRTSSTIRSAEEINGNHSDKRYAQHLASGVFPRTSISEGLAEENSKTRSEEESMGRSIEGDVTKPQSGAGTTDISDNFVKMMDRVVDSDFALDEQLIMHQLETYFKQEKLDYSSDIKDSAEPKQNWLNWLWRQNSTNQGENKKFDQNDIKNVELSTEYTPRKLRLHVTTSPTSAGVAQLMDEEEDLTNLV